MHMWQLLFAYVIHMQKLSNCKTDNLLLQVRDELRRYWYTRSYYDVGFCTVEVDYRSFVGLFAAITRMRITDIEKFEI